MAVLAALALIGLSCLAARPAVAQSGDQVPPQVAGATIVDKPDAQIPLDLKFQDENGNNVTTGQYFNQGKPVLLSIVYLKCPMLCTLVVNGMVDALKQVKYTPGKDFTMLTVSMSPLETSGLAKLKRENYLSLYNRAGAESGWHFLTGTEGQIKQLAASVGFGYKWDPEAQMYAHQAGIFVVTPAGRLSRTLYGTTFDPTTLKGSLLNAGLGAIGTPLDKVYFACMHFDASQGKYTASTMALTRIVAGAVLLVLVLALVGYFRFEAAQRRRAAIQDDIDDDSAQGGQGSGPSDDHSGLWQANLSKGTQ